LSIPARIEESRVRSPIEIIGEKSMFPMCIKDMRLKSPRYGSQMEEINLPNLVNLSPGIQDIIISIKQKIV